MRIEYKNGKLAVYPSTPPTKEQSVALAMKFPGKVLTSLGKNPCYNIKADSTDGIGAILEEIFKIYSPNKPDGMV